MWIESYVTYVIEAFKDSKDSDVLLSFWVQIQHFWRKFPKVSKIRNLPKSTQNWPQILEENLKQHQRACKSCPRVQQTCDYTFGSGLGRFDEELGKFSEKSAIFGDFLKVPKIFSEFYLKSYSDLWSPSKTSWRCTRLVTTLLWVAGAILVEICADVPKNQSFLAIFCTCPKFFTNPAWALRTTSEALQKLPHNTKDT